ncbi:hemerythrin domain-containing protein [Modestobacter sp. I12A-02628]|uniref:Hemerythrin domain-containing protein n=1 Tax=Goekera deserti TaxID=2497753 RepID=A0A7K3W9C9_9ACTN|nr:hemerythrin domain-containing protein [Goekera deserti]MPQ98646.1 hemerythrin domain-containing protein [Goekera deserti]NDI49208.1 hemerythrin domain-containing protein [Goekera deserti]NEL52946.1 hemerythrin domain-containing protein [Goekera deserti]
MTRSIAHQTIAELGGPGSVLVRQRRDHAELDRLIQRLDGAQGTDQEEVLMRLDRLVFSHAFAEEAVLWPVVRRVLPDGEALTLRIEQEHQEVNELVSALEEGGLDDPGRPARLARLVEVLREDVRDEEDLLLPQLQEAVGVAELRSLGRRWALVSRIAPTRPHPTVSRRPPGNAASALPLSLLDRTRDLVDTLTRRAPARLAPVGRAVSAGLASVAGVVERVPLARRGDREPTSR